MHLHFLNAFGKLSSIFIYLFTCLFIYLLIVYLFQSITTEHMTSLSTFCFLVSESAPTSKYACVSICKYVLLIFCLNICQFLYLWVSLFVFVLFCFLVFLLLFFCSYSQTIDNCQLPTIICNAGSSHWEVFLKININLKTLK